MGARHAALLIFCLFIVSALAVSEFYNRERELAAFKGIMRDSSLIAITGPRNTGKSWLIKKILEDFPNKIHFDLRQLKFKDPYNFCDRLRSDFGNFFDNVKSALKTRIGFTYFLTLELTPQQNEPTCDLQEVLIRIEQLLSAKSLVEDQTVFQTLTTLPVLWIDEANNLDQLRQSPEGTQMLQSLFDWFVRITKQNRNFIVILSSSDSFFLDWLAERNVRPYTDMFVIGDLDKPAAQKFFDHLPCDIEKPDFEQVYQVIGGRMFDLERFLLVWQVTGGNVNLETYSPIMQSVAQFNDALDVDYWKFQHPGSPPPEWTNEKLLLAMELIQEKCWVEKEKLDEMIGKRVVRSLLQHNIFHYRPTAEFAFDIPVAEIITTERPFECVALKKILAKKRMRDEL